MRYLRMCAVSVVAGGLVLGCSTDDPPPPTDTHVEDVSAHDALSDTILETVNDIGTTWKGLGAPAVSMQAQSFRKGEDTPECGGMSVSTTSVCFYTSPPLLNWDRDQMVSLKDEGGALAPVIVLAREYGRILLAATNSAYSGYLPTLQAECLAGVYVHERGSVYTDDIGDAVQRAYDVTAEDAVDPEFKLQRKMAFYTFARSEVGNTPLKSCMEARF